MKTKTKMILLGELGREHGFAPCLLIPQVAEKLRLITGRSKREVKAKIASEFGYPESN